MTARPNELGLFPRVITEIGETVEISLTMPDGEPGEQVMIQAEDGGSISGGPPVSQASLDDLRTVQFSFRGTDEGGLSRVTLRRGFDERHLEFWADPEPISSPTQ